MIRNNNRQMSSPGSTHSVSRLSSQTHRGQSTLRNYNMTPVQRSMGPPPVPSDGNFSNLMSGTNLRPQLYAPPLLPSLNPAMTIHSPFDFGIFDGPYAPGTRHMHQNVAMEWFNAPPSAFTEQPRSPQALSVSDLHSAPDASLPFGVDGLLPRPHPSNPSTATWLVDDTLSIASDTTKKSRKYYTQKGGGKRARSVRYAGSVLGQEPGQPGEDSASKKHVLICSEPNCSYTCTSTNDLDRHRTGKHRSFKDGDRYWMCPNDGRCKDKNLLHPRKDNFITHMKAKHGKTLQSKGDEINKYMHIWRQNQEDPGVLVQGMDPAFDGGPSETTRPLENLPANMELSEYQNDAFDDILDVGMFDLNTEDWAAPDGPKKTVATFDRFFNDDDFPGFEVDQELAEPLLSVVEKVQTISPMDLGMSTMTWEPLPMPDASNHTSRTTARDTDENGSAASDDTSVDDSLVKEDDVKVAASAKPLKAEDVLRMLASMDPAERKKFEDELPRSSTTIPLPTSTPLFYSLQNHPPPLPQAPKLLHQCKECNKGFPRESVLKKHQRRHERPYACFEPYCDSRFGSKSDWKRHDHQRHNFTFAGTGHSNSALKHAVSDNSASGASLSVEYEQAGGGQSERRVRNGAWCGFCRKNMEKGEDYYNHVEDHLLGRRDFRPQTHVEWVDQRGK